MFLKIKNKIEAELARYLGGIDKAHSLAKISPLLSRSIKNYIARKGKRIRPLLFAIGYLGFTKKPAAGLYKSALSLELLHDFLLIHDDIIDKSLTRRGAPSMHAMLNKPLIKCKDIKFNGEDLAIVAGDIIYALAIDAFLSVKETPQRKEAALKKFTEAAILTGGGEFVELLYGIKKIDKITIADIYKIYDLKTANYTFSAPLCIGAILAGAKIKELKILSDLGVYLGRAFQIKDDYLGIFAKERKIGKSNLTDLKEAKKTILIWHAYHNSDKKNKLTIKKIFAKNNADKRDLLIIRKILADCKTPQYAQGKINALIEKAELLIRRSGMLSAYKEAFINYAKEMLTL